jgi:probable rRNA maturation factor
MLEFNFKNKTTQTIFVPRLEKIAQKFSKVFYPKKDCQISATVVDQKEMARLNQEYFSKKEPTDVISIETKSNIKPQSLGEIVICADVAGKQAKNLNHSFSKEIEILFQHGLIHLLGKEHRTLSEKTAWKKLLNHLRKA